MTITEIIIIAGCFAIVAGTVFTSFKRKIKGEKICGCGEDCGSCVSCCYRPAKHGKQL